jgi:hypothetical protein
MAFAVATADISATVNRPLRTIIRAIAIGPPDNQGRHPVIAVFRISYNRLIGRFLFDYIGNSPIT